MRYSFALTSALVLAAGAYADEIDDAIGDAASVAAPSATSSAIVKPQFTVSFLHLGENTPSQLRLNC